MGCLKILARDCLSGDDETSEVCANAMSQLAFATFSTTVMLTYLVTYMKYIKELVHIFTQISNVKSNSTLKGYKTNDTWRSIK